MIKEEDLDAAPILRARYATMPRTGNAVELMKRLKNKAGNAVNRDADGEEGLRVTKKADSDAEKKTDIGVKEELLPFPELALSPHISRASADT